MSEDGNGMCNARERFKISLYSAATSRLEARARKYLDTDGVCNHYFGNTMVGCIGAFLDVEEYGDQMPNDEIAAARSLVLYSYARVHVYLDLLDNVKGLRDEHTKQNQGTYGMPRTTYMIIEQNQDKIEGLGFRTRLLNDFVMKHLDEYKIYESRNPNIPDESSFFLDMAMGGKSC